MRKYRHHLPFVVFLAACLALAWYVRQDVSDWLQSRGVPVLVKKDGLEIAQGMAGEGKPSKNVAAVDQMMPFIPALLHTVRDDGQAALQDADAPEELKNLAKEVALARKLAAAYADGGELQVGGNHPYKKALKIRQDDLPFLKELAKENSTEVAKRRQEYDTSFGNPVLYKCMEAHQELAELKKVPLAKILADPKSLASFLSDEILENHKSKLDRRIEAATEIAEKFHDCKPFVKIANNERAKAVNLKKELTKLAAASNSDAATKLDALHEILTHLDAKEHGAVFEHAKKKAVEWSRGIRLEPQKLDDKVWILRGNDLKKEPDPRRKKDVRLVIYEKEKTVEKPLDAYADELRLKEIKEPVIHVKFEDGGSGPAAKHIENTDKTIHTREFNARLKTLKERVNETCSYQTMSGAFTELQGLSAKTDLQTTTTPDLLRRVATALKALHELNP